jgi:adenylate kinase family enzyme
MGRRISVAGISGSGKTTTGRSVADPLGLAHVELDALFQVPNWSQPAAEEFRRRVLAAIDGIDGWVIDGNYHGHLEGLVLERADTLVWLDLPLRTCLRRMARRTWRRIRTREDLWSSGNRERVWTAFLMRNSLLHWTVKAYFRHHREWPARFSRYPNLEVIRLRSPRDVERWLSTL